PTQSLAPVSALYGGRGGLDEYKLDITSGQGYGDPFGFDVSGGFGAYDLGSNPYDLYPGGTPSGITTPPLGVNDVATGDLIAASNRYGGILSTDNPEA